MSQISDTLIRNKDGSLILGGYSIYIGQLIFTLATNTHLTKPIISQVLIFLALIMLREYKKKSQSMEDSETMTEPDINQEILRTHNILIHNEERRLRHPISDIQQERVQQTRVGNVADSPQFQHQVYQQEGISPRNISLSPMEAERPY